MTEYTGEFIHGERLCANTYPSIIDKATFAKVQKRLQQNKILALTALLMYTFAMFKWLKIIKSQYLGLWLLGLLLFAIQEIPYMIMPLIPLTTNPIMEMSVNSVFLDICEKILGVLSVAIMVLIVHKDNKLFSICTKEEKAFFFVALGIIAFNLIGWILYFCGIQNVALMIFFIFALPPLYYLFIGLWRKNYFLVVVSSLFFIVHLSNAIVNLT